MGPGMKLTSGHSVQKRALCSLSSARVISVLAACMGPLSGQRLRTKCVGLLAPSNELLMHQAAHHCNELQA